MRLRRTGYLESASGLEKNKSNTRNCPLTRPLVLLHFFCRVTKHILLSHLNLIHVERQCNWFSKRKCETRPNMLNVDDLEAKL